MSSALRVSVAKGWLPQDALASAQLIETVASWYQIVTARTKCEGLQKVDPTGRTEVRLKFLADEFIPLLQQIVPVQQTRSALLPAQVSVLICTKAVLTVFEDHVLKGISY